ncbi:Transcriptional regulatory protein FixJ [Stieleria neptunia]|uniref:Transcriptional regulatory protein FixJ n=1 Tax=Stieleria neptunia TaxID=2527979 RepID=A0A518I0D8_9BACT|nr:response regulator [Stieleria neptunia]QDV46559.1 Transcriptional regulatory protein FixJ [Stieleria neptunia]
MPLISTNPVKELDAPDEASRLYIVDDETELLTTLAESLRELGFSPQTFDRPENLLLATSENETGCVITDLRMPGIGGVELLRRLNQRDSCLSVILLTAFADVPTAVDAMKLGAVSVVEKPFELHALADEINAAMRCSEQAYARRQDLRSARQRLDQLTNEEKAVLDLAIEGRPNREIAEQLEISPRTVDRRRQSALRKLVAESVAEYAVLKTRAGRD